MSEDVTTAESSAAAIATPEFKAFLDPGVIHFDRDIITISQLASDKSCHHAKPCASHPHIIMDGNFNAAADESGDVSGRLAIRVIGHFGGFRP